jgi:hypothetical protein
MERRGADSSDRDGSDGERRGQVAAVVRCGDRHLP